MYYSEVEVLFLGLLELGSRLPGRRVQVLFQLLLLFDFVLELGGLRLQNIVRLELQSLLLKVISPLRDQGGQLRRGMGTRKYCCLRDSLRLKKNIDAAVDVGEEEEGLECHVEFSGLFRCLCHFAKSLLVSV